jgi:hypothetical protein
MGALLESRLARGPHDESGRSAVYYQLFGVRSDYGPCLFLAIMMTPIGVTLYALIRLLDFRNRAPKKENSS